MPNEETRKAKREAARKARIEAQRAREKAKKRKRMMIGGLVAAVALLAGFLIFQRYQQTERAVKQAAQQAGCSDVREIKPMENSDHLGPNDPEPKYNSNPPTSGRHLGNTAPWGVQDQTVDKKLLVHNLEHGGIVVHYKGLQGDDIDKINDLVEGYADGVIAQPNDEIDKPIALASWGKLVTCEKISIEVLRNFIKEQCNKGPEKFGLRCG